MANRTTLGKVNLASLQEPRRQFKVMRLTVNPDCFASGLGTVAAVLVVAHMGGLVARFGFGQNDLNGLVPLFNIDGEQNIPCYFAVLLMLMASCLSAAIAVSAQKSRAPYVSKWAILSLGFLYMSYDEAFRVHERLIMPVRELIGGDRFGIFYYTWVIPGIAVVIVLAFYFLRFLLSLPPPTRRRFVVAGALYVGGAIGMELIGGRYAELHGGGDWTYSMIVTVEEGLEMAGLIVFIRALLKYCEASWGELRFEFGDTSHREA